MNASTAIQYAVTAAFVARGAYVGFRRPPGAILSWPMFSELHLYRVDVTSDRTGEPVNLWAYRPHLDVAGGLYQLALLLRFLSSVHGEPLSGTGVYVTEHGEADVVIQAGRITHW